MILPILLFSSLILSAEPNQPTEIIGSAATPNGGRNEITIEQPQDAPNPFGYIAPPEPQEQLNSSPEAAAQPTPKTIPYNIKEPLISQTSTTNPQDMSMNPLDYQNKIENTIYQSGNRLIDIQSVPIKAINKALTPNIQPTVSDYPAW